MSRQSGGAAERAYRRSPHLIAHWTATGPVVENFATGQRAPGAPIVHQILTACDRWQTFADVARLLPAYPSRSLAVVISALAKLTFLQQSDRPIDAAETRLEDWAGWNPAAAYFHCATRDVKYSTDIEAAGRQMRAKARRDPLPAAVKRYRGLPVTRLPKPDTDGEFARVLQDRRTWRRFSRTPSTLAQE